MCLKFFFNKSSGSISNLWKPPKRMRPYANRKIKDMPDEKIIRLSDAYEVKREEKSLEMTVKMININYGNKKELMKHCSKLEEYAIFVH